MTLNTLRIPQVVVLLLDAVITVGHAAKKTDEEKTQQPSRPDGSFLRESLALLAAVVSNLQRIPSGARDVVLHSIFEEGVEGAEEGCSRCGT